MQAIDQTLMDHCHPQEVIRCLHIGLLCVQEDPTKRPTMASVILMLNSHSVSLPAPSAPAFINHSGSSSGSDVVLRGREFNLQGRDQSRRRNGKPSQLSENEVSISELEPR